MPLALRKRGKFWHVRGVVPMRQADGSIKNVRIEETTRETGEARARRAADRIWDYYAEQAYRPKAKACPSFTDAALVYVESKHPSKRDKSFVRRLVAHFGEEPIDEIDQAAVSAAAHKLYPDCSPATHVRAVWAPVTTVLRINGVRPDFRRPKVPKAKLVIPPEDWFDAVLPECPPKLGALLVTLTLTSRRISELLSIEEMQSDGTAIIPKSKGGDPVRLTVPSLARHLLGEWKPGTRDGGSRRLFGYADKHNVYRALKAACKRAGVPCFGTHAIGRHSFASRLLKEGRSLKHVQDAGGWKTIKMVADRYGHLEHSEVDRDVKELGEEWGKKRRILPKTAENG